MSEVACGIEWPGTWVPSGVPLVITGWVFDPQEQITYLHAQIDDGQYAPCSSEILPDQTVGLFVGKTSVQFARVFANKNFESFQPLVHKRRYKFASVLGPLDLFGEHSLRIVARFGSGEERELLCQTLLFVSQQDLCLKIFSESGSPLWDMPRLDLSALTKDEASMPLFVLGDDSAEVHAFVSAVCKVTKSPMVDEARLFYAMRRWVVEAKNPWDQFLKWECEGWDQRQLSSTAVGNFKIYSVINEILEVCIEHLRAEAGASSWISPLPPDMDHGMLYWLKYLYPRAKFILVESSYRMETDCEDWEGFLGHVKSQPFQKCAFVSRNEATCAENQPLLPPGVISFLESFIMRANEAAETDTAANGVSDPSSTDWLLHDINATDERILERLSAFPEERPVFIVGSARSGTSALVGALAAEGIQGWNEGHLFPLGHTMMDGLLRSWREIASLFPHWPCSNLDVVKVLDTVTRAIHSTYKKEWPDVTWLDKTPDSRMLDCVPLLVHMYPQIRIVCMRRHLFPWIASRRRKFCEAIDFSCYEWTTFLKRWKEVKASLTDDCWIEFDQTDLTQRTPFVAQSLQKLLTFDYEATRGIETYLTKTRPEATVDPIVASILRHGLENEDPTSRRVFRRKCIYGNLQDRCSEKLGDVGLTPEEADEVKRQCCDIAADYGYRLDIGPSSIPEVLAEITGQIETLEFELCATNRECQNAELNLAQKTRIFEEELHNWRRTAAHRDKTISWLQKEVENWKHVAEERERRAEDLATRLAKLEQAITDAGG